MADQPRRAARLTRRLSAFACLAMVALTSIACSSDDETRSSSQSGSTDVCAARDELESSIEALTKVDLRAEGTNGFDTALDGVKQAIDHLASTAESQYKDEVQRVRDAYDRLRSTVSSFEASTASAGISSISSAASDLTTAIGDLANSVQRC